MPYRPPNMYGVAYVSWFSATCLVNKQSLSKSPPTRSLARSLLLTRRRHVLSATCSAISRRRAGVAVPQSPSRCQAAVPALAPVRPLPEGQSRSHHIRNDQARAGTQPGSPPAKHPGSHSDRETGMPLATEAARHADSQADPPVLSPEGASFSYSSKNPGTFHQKKLERLLRGTLHVFC